MCVIGALLCPRGSAARPPWELWSKKKVHDESGGPVPGATITVTEVRTNITRTAVSNATGIHFTTRIVGLPRRG